MKGWVIGTIIGLVGLGVGAYFAYKYYKKLQILQANIKSQELALTNEQNLLIKNATESQPTQNSDLLLLMGT